VVARTRTSSSTSKARRAARPKSWAYRARLAAQTSHPTVLSRRICRETVMVLPAPARTISLQERVDGEDMATIAARHALLVDVVAGHVTEEVVAIDRAFGATGLFFGGSNGDSLLRRRRTNAPVRGGAPPTSRHSAVSLDGPPLSRGRYHVNLSHSSSRQTCWSPLSTSRGCGFRVDQDFG